MLLLLAGCAWIGGQKHDENLERWSVRIESVEGDLQRCGPTLDVNAKLSAQRAGETVGIEVRIDGQTAAADAVVADDGTTRWTVGPFDEVSAEELTYQLVIDSSVVPWTTTFEQATRYRDDDGDGYGGEPTTTCEPGQAVVDDDTDCDDSNPDVNPGAHELCTAIDEDCDGDPVSGAVDTAIYYDDSDGDGLGDDSTAVETCQPDSGAVTIGGDCDDADPHLGAPVTWAPDADGDALGSNVSSTWVTSCDDESPLVPNTDDCDDEAATIGATAYADSDGDGFGGAMVAGCPGVGGSVAIGGDCDDANLSINPDQHELCTPGIDENCDGHPTVDAVDQLTFYVDSDVDLAGDPEVAIDACTQPLGYVANDHDCDDTTGTIGPTVDETCDGVDNNCNGLSDEGMSNFWIDQNEFPSFEQAINAADPGQTIVVCSDASWPDQDSLDDADLTLVSAGSTVTGSLRVDNADLTFVGLNLVGGDGTTGGVSDVEGGVLSAQNSTVRFEGCSLTCSTNAAVHRGGALQLTQSALELVGTSVIDCTANRGGAIALTQSDLSTAPPASTLSDNRAETFGGALYVQDSTLEILPGSLVVQSNEAGNDGGGAHLSDSSGAIAGTWTDNVSHGDAGGGAFIAGNDGIHPYVISGSWSLNRAASWGGAMVITEGSVQLAGVELSGNHATFGGGVYVLEAGQVSMSGATVQGNTAAQSGGGLFAETAVPIDTSLFTGNMAGIDPDTYGGGAAMLTDADVLIEHTTFESNTAVRGGGLLVAPGPHSAGTLQLLDTTFFSNGAQAGAGLWASGVDVQLAGAVDFDQNIAHVGEGGGALFTENEITGGRTSPADCGSLTGTGTADFQSNTAGGNGGGLAMITGAGTSCTLQLGGTATFQSNVAADGAAIELLHPTPADVDHPSFGGLDLLDNATTGDPSGAGMIHFELDGSGELRTLNTTFHRDTDIGWVHLTDATVLDEVYSSDILTQPRTLVCTAAGCNAQ